MSSLPQLTVAYALDSGESIGPMFDSEDEARSQPEHGHLGWDVVRCYVNSSGRIVHTETISNGPEE